MTMMTYIQTLEKSAPFTLIVENLCGCGIYITAARVCKVPNHSIFLQVPWYDWPDQERF